MVSGKFEQLTNYFCKIDGVLKEQLKNDFEYLVNVFTDAKEYGSILEVEKVNFEALKQRLKEVEEDNNFVFGDYRKLLLDKLPMIIKQAEIMSRKYEVCVTNPPYMGRRKSMNDTLSKYIDILNPTVTIQVGDLKQIPVSIKREGREEINKLVNENIQISKQEWDNDEISWNFKTSILLKDIVYSMRLKECIKNLKDYAISQRNKLKYNEEKLNKYFLDIYDLNNEFEYEVEDEDIKIYKIVESQIVKSFLSYAVGCMLGRYSIDAEGLIYAGGDFKDKWNLDEKKVRKIQKDDDGNAISDSWIEATFLPDKDNVIPITEDEYFEDDIVSRFIDFVRIVYGEETLEENLDFIADSISRKASETSRQAIRRYFIKDFYKDHLKVYKKRPIYWMFDSGKNNGFKALIYMHRYNEQTIAKVRTDYLHTLQRKYESEIERQQLIVDSGEYSAKDRTTAKKKIAKIVKQIEECREYDQVVAHLANEKISIDLDDGVKVNYAKFQGVKVINSKEKEVKMNLLAKI